MAQLSCQERVPEACRALQARGIMTGSAHFAREGEPVHMRMDPAKGAGMRTHDDARGLSREKWEKAQKDEPP
jgi:hypothetical protein